MSVCACLCVCVTCSFPHVAAGKLAERCFGAGCETGPHSCGPQPLPPPLKPLWSGCFLSFLLKSTSRSTSDSQTEAGMGSRKTEAAWVGSRSLLTGTRMDLRWLGQTPGTRVHRESDLKVGRCSDVDWSNWAAHSSCGPSAVAAALWGGGGGGGQFRLDPKSQIGRELGPQNNCPAFDQGP